MNIKIFHVIERFLHKVYQKEIPPDNPNQEHTKSEIIIVSFEKEVHILQIEPLQVVSSNSLIYSCMNTNTKLGTTIINLMYLQKAPQNPIC